MEPQRFADLQQQLPKVHPPSACPFVCKQTAVQTVFCRALPSHKIYVTFTGKGPYCLRCCTGDETMETGGNNGGRLFELATALAGHLVVTEP